MINCLIIPCTSQIPAGFFWGWANKNGEIYPQNMFQKFQAPDQVGWTQSKSKWQTWAPPAGTSTPLWGRAPLEMEIQAIGTPFLYSRSFWMFSKRGASGLEHKKTFTFNFDKMTAWQLVFGGSFGLHILFQTSALGSRCWRFRNYLISDGTSLTFGVKSWGLYLTNLRILLGVFTATSEPFHEPHARGVKAPNMSTINVTPNPVTVARCRMDGDGMMVVLLFGLWRNLVKLEDVLKAPIPPERYFFQKLEVGCYHVTHLKKSTQKRNLRIIQSYHEPSECRNDLKFISNVSWRVCLWMYL